MKHSTQDRSARHGAKRVRDRGGAGFVVSIPARNCHHGVSWANVLRRDRAACCRREATGLAGASDPSAGPVYTFQGIAGWLYTSRRPPERPLVSAARSLDGSGGLALCPL